MPKPEFLSGTFSSFPTTQSSLISSLTSELTFLFSIYFDIFKLLQSAVVTASQGAEVESPVSSACTTVSCSANPNKSLRGHHILSLTFLIRSYSPRKSSSTVYISAVVRVIIWSHQTPPPFQRTFHEARNDISNTQLNGCHKGNYQ